MLTTLAIFLLVCVVEGVAGSLVWNAERTRAVIALVLVPVGAIFWWGFALPFPPLLAAVRTILIVVRWQSFR